MWSEECGVEEKPPCSNNTAGGSFFRAVFVRGQTKTCSDSSFIVPSSDGRRQFFSFCFRYLIFGVQVKPAPVLFLSPYL